MSRKLSNEIVMYLGISIILGGIFPDFRNNQQLIVSITFSAVCFSIFDLIVSLGEKTSIYQVRKIALFIGIFSVVVLPYLDFLSDFLIEQNNFFTLIGLAIVIFLIGYRQNIKDNEDINNLHSNFNKQKNIIEEQNKLIEEQNKILQIYNEKSNKEK
ncbi:hypothetical protein CYL18_14305 [Pradoshia eiseniae]|uniref:Uncharacterized protein n=1 Tax=Pradoshia eiseniae TaxID=2064768 RepID=A0A2S7MX61_9BACI|nr:hypothetical protein [Pradoshia eiseniae]PQD94384.1 hypothetical protein CYL18_14305 [Pradoshia eiseniae]